MDSQEVTRVLVDIFKQYGPQILCARKKFESCLSDLLNENKYSRERTVFQQAMEKTTLLPLAGRDFMSDGLTGRTTEQLIKDNSMEEDDARFVVECIVAARIQAQGIPFSRVENSQPPTQKLAFHMYAEMESFPGGEVHWEFVENHLLRWENSWRRSIENNAQRLKAAVIALCLAFVAVYPSWGADAAPPKIEGTQQTAPDDRLDHDMDDLDRKEDSLKSSVSGSVPQQAQD